RGQPAWVANPYPDANRTLRFTYGDVKGYVPHDAAIYQPFTNLSGVIEKDTGREPFDVPAKLKQLFRARDFGPYATPDGQIVPVDFLSTTDIIGGNSGSPIMNGRGEQVGIVFDGNYEGLGNDFFYNDAKGRTISVDIRYVLFILDKFGGAGYLLKELDIRNAPATMRRAQYNHKPNYFAKDIPVSDCARNRQEEAKGYPYEVCAKTTTHRNKDDHELYHTQAHTNTESSLRMKH